MKERRFRRPEEQLRPVRPGNLLQVRALPSTRSSLTVTVSGERIAVHYLSLIPKSLFRSKLSRLLRQFVVNAFSVRCESPSAIRALGVEALAEGLDCSG